MQIPVIVTWHEKGQPTWPNPYWDCEVEGQRFAAKLAQAFAEVEFPVEVAQTEEQAKEIIERYKDAIGAVVYMASNWGPVVPVLAQSGMRLVLVDALYAGSGGFLSYYAQARNRGDRVAAVASSNFEDVTRAVNVLVALGRLRGEKMLVYSSRDASGFADLLKQDWGVELVQRPLEELVAAYEAADEAEATQLARRWVDEAEEVVEPSEDDIFEAARLYLAMRQQMEEIGAAAITIDCLTYVYGGALDAYPCLGFMELNSIGSIGVCEADITSTLCFQIFRALANRPGYVSDPVIDEGAGQIIYAHCVATVRPFGPDTAACPYTIRSHAEDDKGAAMQSFLPLGWTTTTIQVSPHNKVMTLHTARSVANVVTPLACRTKLACEVDATRVLENWNVRPGFGWHRVTAYGDFRREITYLAKLQGYELVEEDR
ncbi:MAG: hypothetical protein J7M26_08880 [Armatimonadetes bacterium]|nr:hypothetical protein [Armatimonadota bacterium]